MMEDALKFVDDTHARWKVICGKKYGRLT